MGYADADKQREYQRKRVAKARSDWLDEHGPCVKCGSSDRLEVDHVDRATKVTHSVWSWAVARRNEELAKCQVLCHECHKEKTKSEFTMQLIHGTVAGYSKGCRCIDCGAAQRERIYAWRIKVGGRKAPNKIDAGSLGGSPVS